MIKNLAGLKGIDRHDRQIRWGAFSLFVFLGFFVAGVLGWIGLQQYQQIQSDFRKKSEIVALGEGSIIDRLLSVHYDDLQYLTTALLLDQNHRMSVHINGAISHQIKTFMRAHPYLRRINILDANGKTVIWSSTRRNRPALPGKLYFRSIQGHPNREMGPITRIGKTGHWVLPMRYRIVNFKGKLIGLIGAPYLLSRLSVLHPDSDLIIALREPFLDQFAGFWVGGKWYPPNHHPPHFAGKVSHLLARSPLALDVGWSRSVLWTALWKRLRFDVVFFVLIELVLCAVALAAKKVLDDIIALRYYQGLTVRVIQKILVFQDQAKVYRIVLDLLQQCTPASLVLLVETRLPTDQTWYIQGAIMNRPIAHSPVPIRLVKALTGNVDELHACLRRMRETNHGSSGFFPCHLGLTDPADAYVNRVACQSLLIDNQTKAPLFLVIGVKKHFLKNRFVRLLPYFLEQLAYPLGLALIRIGQQKQLLDEKESVRYAAYHDALTGLPNRLALEDHLQRVTARAIRHHRLYAVGFIDLDDFKPINDKYGHDAGDSLLCGLANRLQQKLRDTDFIARMGGDEFVVILEDLSEQHYRQQLDQILSRLHEAVEQSFELENAAVLVDLSMGVAISDRDKQMDSDVLLRQADAAMYKIKNKKGNSAQQWWALFQDDLGDIEPQSMPPFGPESACLLAEKGPFIRRLVTKFVEELLVLLHNDAEVETVFQIFRATADRVIAKYVEDHLHFLVSDIAEENLIQEAQRIGRIYTHVGQSMPLLIKGVELLRKLMVSHVDDSGFRAGERYQLLQVMMARLDIDQRGQLQGVESIYAEYQSILTHPVDTREGWASIRHAELQRLGQLEGIAGAILMRPDPEGFFITEDRIGEAGRRISNSVNRSELRLKASAHKEDASLIARSWGKLSIMAVDTYPADRGMMKWASIVKQAGVRSMLAIPLRDKNGHAISVLALYGQWPHQFSSTHAQEWAEGIRYRWEEFLRCSDPTIPLVSIETSEIWRSRLFTGGLRLYLQPIVDLETGQILKAEGLARLELENGGIITPNLFLPLLGGSECYRLFRLTFDEAWHCLEKWKSLGMNWQLSINLPPSCLRESDLIPFLRKKIQKGGFQPDRLILELLETEKITDPQQEWAISEVRRLGITLALDDLGSGYSSLLRVVNDPIDVLKVDRNLMVRLEKDPKTVMTMLSVLIHLGNDLDREIVIEGLETVQMIDMVRQLGARQGQGYAIARPMPSSEFVPWASQYQCEWLYA